MLIKKMPKTNLKQTMSNEDLSQSGNKSASRKQKKSKCFNSLVEQHEGGIDNLQFKNISNEWLKLLLTCTNSINIHTPNKHIKISHIALEEIKSLHKEMSCLLPAEPTYSATSPPVATGDQLAYSVIEKLKNFLHQPVRKDKHSKRYIRIDVKELEEDPSIFERLWTLGQIIVVTVMDDRLKVLWTPNYFISKCLGDQCKRINSISDDQTPEEVHVKNFLTEFVKTTESQKSWKIQDWPPEADFQTHFSDLFNDFQHAIPIPDITSWFGLQNMAAHFPTKANTPDMSALEPAQLT
ncbi:hypothetical protein H4Q26_013525 [Puccinia striiformis f. sp. tritici PST-130]|nr:hypothetical protein H4Q26_013525 [Puccinia striiformis f. sp. tritici PST-130]